MTKKAYVTYYKKQYGYSEKKAEKMWAVKCLLEDPHYDAETGKACYRALERINEMD